MKYRPEKIEGNFDCSYNNLTSLQYAPKDIGEVFDCRYNYDLKNIKQQIIENQIKAKTYITDLANFDFETIKKEFFEYQNKINTRKKLKKDIVIKIKEQDFGFGL